MVVDNGKWFINVFFFVIMANEWILIMASGLQILIIYIYIYIYVHTMVYYGKYLVAHPTDRK